MGAEKAFDALVVEITRGVTRFALGLGASGNGGKPVLGHYHKVQTAEFGDFRSLLGHYIDQLGGMSEMPPVLALSHAGPQIGDRIIIPGCDLNFTIDEIRQVFPFQRVINANDCVAMGSALPWLERSDVISLASANQKQYDHEPGRYGLVVPTYGLGVASVIHTGEAVQVIDSEGGHANFAPMSEWHAKFLMDHLSRGQKLSFDEVISYPGLELLYNYVAGCDNPHAPDLRAQEILLYARNEADANCLEAIRQFCRALGAMAGDVALMLGAVNGMFLVSPFINEVFELGGDLQTLIRKEFEAKSDFSLYMQRIPLYLITHRRASMIGVLRLACEGDTVLAE